MLETSCLCGRVHVSISRRPDFLNECNCTLCTTHGGRWGYYRAAEVRISGVTTGYRRSDLDEVCLELNFCPHCGTTTHWTPTDAFIAGNDGYDRMGVNMRLFDPAALSGIELRFPNGRLWDKSFVKPPKVMP